MQQEGVKKRYQNGRSLRILIVVEKEIWTAGRDISTSAVHREVMPSLFRRQLEAFSIKTLQNRPPMPAESNDKWRTMSNFASMR
jgi:hypothetical protein